MTRPQRLLVFTSALLGFALLAGAANIPRPEYPEPQFMRSSWMSLNGEWNFAFDDQNQGLAKNWNTSGLPDPRAINVPYCFESQLSGIHDTAFHPVFWYNRGFALPEG
jgi:beta-galactosidase/beta-glucuronidase